jgi:D-alanyl-D-alanine carboxypeptidase
MKHDGARRAARVPPVREDTRTTVEAVRLPGAESQGRSGVSAISRRTVLSTATVFGVSALAAGCSSKSPSSPPPATATRSTGTSSGSTPGSAVIDEAALRTLFARTAKELLTPGAVCILRTSQGSFSVTYGSRADDRSTPVSLTDAIRIGSITKTFTGTVILQLAQQGRLSIDDPVSKYRPDVPNGNNIIIAQLLTMRSGLHNYTESLEMNQALDTNPTKAWTQAELLAIAFRNPPYFPPGKGYHYSNTNTVLLGLIAEKLAGQPLATVFSTRLFAPLGLRHTGLPGITSNAIPTPHPRGYMYGTNVSTLTSAKLPPAQLAAAQSGTLKPNDVTDENPSWGWSAGAAISTAPDLVTWVQALGDGALLNPTWQKKRLESVRPTEPTNPASASYGFGIARFGSLYGHTGELPGFQSFAGYDPAKHVTLVVWANLSASPDGRPPATTIAQRLIGTIYP